MLISYTPYITGKLSDQCRELQLLKKKGSRQNRRKKEHLSIEQLDSTSILSANKGRPAKNLRHEKSPNLVKNLISFIPYRNFCARTDGSDVVSRWCHLRSPLVNGDLPPAAEHGRNICLASSTSSPTHSPRAYFQLTGSNSRQQVRPLKRFDASSGSIQIPRPCLVTRPSPRTALWLASPVTSPSPAYMKLWLEGGLSEIFRRTGNIAV